jgi:hypothetical protein
VTISGIVEASVNAFIKIFDWATGGRTKDNNAQRKSAMYWSDEYAKAISANDVARANECLRELERVRREARAKSP